MAIRIFPRRCCRDKSRLVSRSLSLRLPRGVHLMPLAESLNECPRQRMRY